jgi:DNA invertase Pin-like site-specific DNA recombinase
VPRSGGSPGPSGPGGRLVFHVFAALAQFIRELIVEGTREGGLDAARTSPALLLNRRGQRLPVRGASNIIRAIGERDKVGEATRRAA